jgi:hypothetical protein
MFGTDPIPDPIPQVSLTHFLVCQCLGLTPFRERIDLLLLPEDRQASIRQRWQTLLRMELFHSPMLSNEAPDLLMVC